MSLDTSGLLHGVSSTEGVFAGVGDDSGASTLLVVSFIRTVGVG